MTPPLLHAEVDTFQVAIIVLAVIFSFVKWLWEQWTGNKSAMSDYDEEPEQPAPALPRKSAAPSRPPPLPASPPPVAAAPWEELRKAWREVREAAQAPKQPQPRTVADSMRHQATSRKPVEAAPPPTPVVSAPSAPPATVQSSAPTAMMTSLRALRHDPAALRRAIVLGEVLGPPKALS